MPKVEISRVKVIIALESRAPKSLSEVYRILGGSGKLSGKLARLIREEVPGIEAILAQNKAAGTSKSKSAVVASKAKPAKKVVKKSSKSAKSSVPRHPQNPFREGSGYGILVDIIADSGSKGIGKENLLKKYGRLKNKSEKLARYDLAVINSAQEGGNRHKSAKDGFTIIKRVDNFRIKFV